MYKYEGEWCHGVQNVSFANLSLSLFDKVHRHVGMWVHGGFSQLVRKWGKVDHQEYCGRGINLIVIVISSVFTYKPKKQNKNKKNKQTKQTKTKQL